MGAKKVFFLMLLLGVLSGYSYAYVYYIPHIHTGSDAWETYLVLDNSIEPELDATVYYYDSNGTLINRENLTINGNSNLTVSLREKGAVAAMVYTGSSYLRVRLGYIAKEDLGGGTAEFSPATKLSQRLLMNTSNYYDQLTWSGFAVWNATDKYLDVIFKAYSEEGELARKTITMAPYHKIVDFFDSFFGLPDFKNIVSITVETDYPALCGVVISGKENDKLLFSSPLMPTYYVNHTETFDGNLTTTNIVYTSGDQKYHTFVYSDYENSYFHVSWNYHGISEMITDNRANYNMDIQYIAASEDENAIYLFGTSGNNYKVVKIDVTGNSNNEWQTVLGEAGYTTPFYADPMDIKIRGKELNGKVFLFYKDKANNWEGTLITLDASNGAKLSENGGLTNSVLYGDMITYEENGQKYIAETFAYYTDKLQVRVFNSNGDIVKQIFGSTPIPNAAGKLHAIFGSQVIGNRMMLVVGVGIDINNGIRQYHLYLISIDLDSDTDFSNATITDLQTFLRHGSSCDVFYSFNFSSTKATTYRKTIQIITTPYYSYDTSSNLLVHLNDDNTPTDYPYFMRKFPYKVNGVAMGLWGIYVIGTDKIYVDLENQRTRTNFIMRFLFIGEMLNY